MEKEVVLLPIVAGVVLKKDDKYLLVQEKQPRAYGLWNLPAGRVDKGDSIEETAVREAKEETGFEVKLVRKLDIFQESEKTPPKHAFEAEIVGGELNYPEDELLGAKWFTLDEIEAMRDELRSEWVLASVKMLA